LVILDRLGFYFSGIWKKRIFLSVVRDIMIKTTLPDKSERSSGRQLYLAISEG
jgi:hypothetical protein